MSHRRVVSDKIPKMLRGLEGASDSFPLFSHYFRVKLCTSSDKIFKYLLRFLPVAL